MKKNRSILEFKNYYIDEFIYKKNEDFTKKNDEQIEVNFDFEFGIERKDDNFKRIVTCYIFDEDYIENNKPFFIKLRINGMFSLSNFDEDNEKHREIITRNTLSILFPYIRSIISHITLEMQVGPVQMPPMNINSFFKSQNN